MPTSRCWPPACRTRDMLRVADAYARLCSGVFSIEMWGGATFDTAMRFLKEDPWERLAQLREKIPNILFQMLLRGSNAVGYTNYPDNVVKAFRQGGGRSRDRSVPRVRLAELGAQHGAIARGGARGRRALRGGHLLHGRHPRTPRRTKYNLEYYVELAKELEKRGANLIAIKDMAGLCKPIRRRATDQGAATRSRRADPLPHPRHRRSAGCQHTLAAPR